MRPAGRISLGQWVRGIVTVIPACVLALGLGCDRKDQDGYGGNERVLRVAAASSMKPALSELAAAFQSSHASVRIVASYGASGSIFAQLSNGAPVDLFLSADMGYPQRLVEAGLAHDQRMYGYAVGRLVLWAPTTADLRVASRGMKALADDRVRHVAIANPAHAPYGRAALEAFAAEGLDQVLRQKLVHGENVEQAAQFADGAAADAALIPLSLALAMRGSGEYWLVPAEHHAPLDHGLVILSGAREPGLARNFVEFLLEGEGRSILEKHGLKAPEQ